MTAASNRTSGRSVILTPDGRPRDMRSHVNSATIYSTHHVISIGKYVRVA